MTNSYIININGIGPILFEKSRRAKHVIISIRTSKGPRVAVPMRTSFKKALEFVYLKREWIQSHLAQTEQNENRNKAFREALTVINREDAKRRLQERLSYLARKCGFIFNKVDIRQQKTRWGSCSPKNNISLNIKLLLLPEELADYVMIHELVHTQIHNHSKRFWAELDKYVGNSKIMAKRLRMNDLRLR